MNKHLIVTVISDDKPGVVKQLANAVSANHGNWLESRLSHLAGKFAGVIRVATSQDHSAQLTAALLGLNQSGMKLLVETAEDEQEQPAVRNARFSAVGPDRPGIVFEISQAFTRYDINVEELNTRYTSMPYSGEPLFEAQGTLSLPESTDWDELSEQMDRIADTLAMDIKIEEDNDQ